jgi:transcriptional regulator with XRE-family HTH domain
MTTSGEAGDPRRTDQEDMGASLSFTGTLTASVSRSPEHIFMSRLRVIRTTRRVTQRALAARLAELGVKLDYSAVARIEQGARGISLNEAVAIALALEVTLESLLVPSESHERIEATPAVTVDRDQYRTWVRGGDDVTELILQLKEAAVGLEAMRSSYDHAVGRIELENQIAATAWS